MGFFFIKKVNHKKMFLFKFTQNHKSEQRRNDCPNKLFCTAVVSSFGINFL